MKIKNYINLDLYKFAAACGISHDKVFEMDASLTDEQVDNFNIYSFFGSLGVQSDKIFEVMDAQEVIRVPDRDKINRKSIGKNKSTKKSNVIKKATSTVSNLFKNFKKFIKRAGTTVMIAGLIVAGSYGVVQAANFVSTAISQAQENNEIYNQGIQDTKAILQDMGIVETADGENYNLAEDYQDNLHNLSQLGNVSRVEQVLLEGAISDCTKNMSYNERETLLNTVYFYSHEDCRQVASEDGYQSGRELAITLRSPDGNPPPSKRDVADAIASGQTFLTSQQALGNSPRGGRS